MSLLEVTGPGSVKVTQFIGYQPAERLTQSLSGEGVEDGFRSVGSDLENDTARADRIAPRGRGAVEVSRAVLDQAAVLRISAIIPAAEGMQLRERAVVASLNTVP